jgi:hypothetical protein
VDCSGLKWISTWDTYCLIGGIEVDLYVGYVSSEWVDWSGLKWISTWDTYCLIGGIEVD